MILNIRLTTSVNITLSGLCNKIKVERTFEINKTNTVG